jgi:hypothetical protein
MAQKQWKCTACGETFESELALDRHNRSAHSQCKCEVCGRILRSESELAIHNRIAHPEEIPMR